MQRNLDGETAFYSAVVQSADRSRYFSDKSGSAKLGPELAHRKRMLMDLAANFDGVCGTINMGLEHADNSEPVQEDVTQLDNFVFALLTDCPAAIITTLG